jgi:hypothetical protein
MLKKLNQEAVDKNWKEAVALLKNTQKNNDRKKVTSEISNPIFFANISLKLKKTSNIEPTKGKKTINSTEKLTMVI